MQTLYPQIKPYARHDLAVDDTHTLYVDESGSPEGLPVVFIHGGPGAGCDAQSRCYFDPNVYRIVTFDQRGCGRSPGSPEQSIADSVADLDALRRHWGQERWVVVGYSFGGSRPRLRRRAPRAGCGGGRSAHQPHHQAVSPGQAVPPLLALAPEVEAALGQAVEVDAVA